MLLQMKLCAYSGNSESASYGPNLRGCEKSPGLLTACSRKAATRDAAYIVCVIARDCGELEGQRLHASEVVTFTGRRPRREPRRPEDAALRKGGSRLDRCESAESASGIPLSLTTPEIRLSGAQIGSLRFAVGDKRLTDLKACHSYDRQHGRSNPKPHDDLDFVLSPEQVMIVQRAARDNSVSG